MSETRMSDNVSRPVVGALLEQNGRATVRMEHRLATDPADVWSALTEPARLARWLAQVTGEARLGGTVQAEFTSGWSGPLRIDVCDEPRRLVVASDPGSAEETVLEANLEPEGDGTLLIVEERGLPLDHAGAYGAGWQVHIEDLDAYLSARATSQWEQRWNQLRGDYDYTPR